MKFLVCFISLLVFSVECVSQLKCLWGLEQWRHLMSWADQRSLPWGNVGHVASSDHDLSFCLVFLGGMHRHDFFHFPVYDHPYYKYFIFQLQYYYHHCHRRHLHHPHYRRHHHPRHFHFLVVILLQYFLFFVEVLTMCTVFCWLSFFRAPCGFHGTISRICCRTCRSYQMEELQGILVAKWVCSHE